MTVRIFVMVASSWPCSRLAGADYKGVDTFLRPLVVVGQVALRTGVPGLDQQVSHHRTPGTILILLWLAMTVDQVLLIILGAVLVPVKGSDREA